MSAHVLLNLLNNLQSILLLFHNKFNKFNYTRAQTLDSIYHMTLRSHFLRKEVIMYATLWTSYHICNVT